MLSNDQPLGNAGFDAVGAVAIIDPADDPLTLDPLTPSAQDLTQYVGDSAPRPRLEDVLNWTDQLLGIVHQLHTQPRPVVHGGIAPSAITLDGGTLNLAPAGSTGSGDANVNFKPLEQIWDGLDHVSKRVILNQFDDKQQNSVHQPLSPASDIYSVGATVYALVTGKVPADALDRTIAAMEGKPDPLTHPSELSPEVAMEIGDAIVRAMSLQREDRPFSAVILRQIFRTASVKVQERLAAGPADSVLEIDVPAAIEAAPAPMPAVDLQKEAEEENARQLALRILAEKSAAAAIEEPLPIEVASENLRSNEHFELAPVFGEAEVSVVEPEPEPKPVEAVQEPVFVEEDKAVHVSEPVPSFAQAVEEEKKSSKGLMIGAAAAVLAVVGIAGFFMFGGSSAPKQQEAPQKVEQAVAPAASADVPPAQSTIENSADAQIPADAAPAAETLDGGPHDRTTHNAAAPVQPAKKATAPAPAPAKPAPTKKQVTMDDLLKGN